MNKKFYASFLIILLSSVPVLSPGAHAAEASGNEFNEAANFSQLPDVFISEINWAGSALSNADEWIEITNASSENVALGGWVLTGAATSGDALALADDFVIEAQSTALISNYDFEHEKTTLAVAPNLISSSLSLSNSTLEIMLAMPDGTVVDSVTKEDQVGSSNPFVSMTRDTDGHWIESTESKNLLDSDQLGTPGSHAFTATETTDTNSEQNMSEEVEEVLEQELEEIEENEERETIVVCTTVYADTGEEVSDSEASEPDPAQPTTTGENDEVVESVEVEEENPEATTQEAQEEEPIEIVTVTGTDVRLNEIVSDPEDGTEWIELFNFGSTNANLFGWSVTDASGKETALPDVTLQPGEFYVLENPSGKLNNGGDSVQLYNAGSVVDEVTYGTNEIDAPKKGESLAYVNDAWIITSEITKNATNPEPNSSEETITENSIEESSPDTETNTAETEAEEHTVIAIADQTTNQNPSSSSTNTTSQQNDGLETVTGTMTAEPGLFGKQIAFIDGIQLYFYKAEWPELKVGDIVKVKGERSESKGEPRIKISSAEDIVVTGKSNLVATTTTANQLNTFTEGTLVELSGTVIERDGAKFTLRDQTGDASFVAHVNTGVSLAGIDDGDVRISGIVRTFEDGVRIYVRSQEDIKPLQETLVADENDAENLAAQIDGGSDTPVNHTQAFGPWIGGGVITTATATIFYWFIKYRKFVKANMGIATN